MTSERQRPLRVLVDATIVKPDLGGYRTYVVELVRALALRSGVAITAVTSVPEDLAGPGVQVIEAPTAVRSFARRQLWRDRRLPGIVRRTEADVLLAPVPEVPLRPVAVPIVAVIHDVTALVVPALWGWERWLRYQVGLRRTLATADLVVAVSNATRQGLFMQLGVDPARCRVIKEGARDLGAAAVNGRHASAADGAPYVLYVGSLLGHKNVRTLVQAVAEAPSGALPRLLLAGPPAGVDELPVDGDRVRHLGFVDEPTLERLYREAAAFAFPSLTEGFGLPVVEAMSRGVPVVASDIGVVREVGADAVAYVADPLEPAGWRDALAGLLADPARRARMAEAGRARAGQFGWPAVAADFEDVLREVADR